MKLVRYLTFGTDYAALKASPEEMLRIFLELSDNMPDKADLLDSCGERLLRSFHGNSNRKEDIDNCILAYESAVHLTPRGHSELSGRLHMLGVSFYHRFHITGDLIDISEAILYQQKARHLTPKGYADIPDRLNSLGNALQSRFKYTGDITDISDAISHQQEAVNLTPKGDADIPNRLNNLGNAFQVRFECSGDLDDISTTISYQQKALHLTPKGRADIPSLVIVTAGNPRVIRGDPYPYPVKPVHQENQDFTYWHLSVLIAA